MKAFILLVLANALRVSAGTKLKKVADDTRDLPVTRAGTRLYLGGKEWRAVGANVYWLGLDENVTPPKGKPFYGPTKASYPTQGRITEAMAIMRAMGATMIRSHTLGVSTGNPLSLMPAPGEWNEAAFDPIDWAVYQAREYGLRLMVPLTDNYDYYHGGKYDWLRWAGYNLSGTDSNKAQIQQFYTNGSIVAAFKDYIQKLVTHVNPYTNLTYAEDPTIFAYETGNELLGPVWGDMNVPADWVRDMGEFIKSLGPDKLFVDGTYGVNETHLGIEEVDIFSDHFYPVEVGKLQSDLDLVASANRSYFAGEYGWTGVDGLSEWFTAIEDSPVAVGDAFWSLFGHNVPDCDRFVEHNDGFTMQYGNPANPDGMTSQIKLVRKHLVAMSRGEVVDVDAALPSVECPAPTNPARGW